MIIRPVYIQKLHETIKHKTAIDLLSSGFDYHSSRRQMFNRDAYNLSRREKKEETVVRRNPRSCAQKERGLLTRSQVNPFDVKLCIFLSGMR